MSSRFKAPASALLLVCVLAIAFVAAGCGDDSDGGSSRHYGGGQDTSSQPATDEADNRGGEASIEDFGSEAAGSDRQAIVGSFQSYLEAIAGEDFATACAHLASTVQESLEELAGGSKHATCSTLLPKILSPTAPEVAQEQAEGKITKIRIDDDRSFVIFQAPGAKLFQMTLAEEAGDWKATTIAASVLVPDL